MRPAPTAGRIMRLPGSFNGRRERWCRVLRADRLRDPLDPEQVRRAIPDPDPPRPAPAPRSNGYQGEDELALIAPPAYFRALAGVEVPAERDDQVPAARPRGPAPLLPGVARARARLVVLRLRAWRPDLRPGEPAGRRAVGAGPARGRLPAGARAGRAALRAPRRRAYGSGSAPHPTPQAYCRRAASGESALESGRSCEPAARCARLPSRMVGLTRLEDWAAPRRRALPRETGCRERRIIRQLRGPDQLRVV